MERFAHGSGYRPLQGYRLGDARGSVRPSAVCNAVPGITHEGLLELPGTPGAWLARAHSPHPQSPVGLEVCAHPHTRARTHARQARILPPRPARLSGRDDTRRLAGPGPEGRRRPRSQTAPSRGEPGPGPRGARPRPRAWRHRHGGHTHPHTGSRFSAACLHMRSVFLSSCKGSDTPSLPQEEQAGPVAWCPPRSGWQGLRQDWEVS